MTPIAQAQPPGPLLTVPVTVGVMLTGYILLMTFLAVGLRILVRGADLPPDERSPEHRGWPGLIRQMAGTALGGYMLLMLVVVGYYKGIAHVPGQFLASAFTGCALLIGVTTPIFLAASWLDVRLRSRPP